MYEFNDRQLDKLQQLRDNGIDPYPDASGVTNTEPIETLVSFGEELSKDQLESVGHEFTIVGRLRFKNALGKIGFGRIQQAGAKIQICVKKQVTDLDSFSAFKKLDVGDWVWARGTLFRTKTGELTLLAEELRLYSKCIEGMPDKHTGIVNPETRQRMRYLDLIVNDDVMDTFVTRSRIIRYIRNFLESNGFMEVETPTLQITPGGASAKPFVTHHNSLNADMYMRVAPELYLKRLLVGGFDRVFEVGKNFRNEGISTKHNPEFTMVEFYQAHSTYKEMMKLTQNLLVGLVGAINGKRFESQHKFAKAKYAGFLPDDDPMIALSIPFGNHTIELNKWGEATYEEVLRRAGVKDPWDIGSFVDFYSNIDDSSIDLSGYPVEMSDDDILANLQQRVFDEYVEPQLINPTFVTHYPVSLSPLARTNKDDPRVTDRFELFIGGMEIANGFSELNDPVEQAQRFAKQAELKAAGDEEAMYFDSDYIKALSYGMPPAAGEGIGIDRLVMLLTNKQSIRDVILFPTLKKI